MSDSRSIETEIEVPGTPEEVWRAIATGPGVTSWYVPHTIEEREGGRAVASFGPGMEEAGRVAAWDPPRRFLIDNGEGVGLAFEWFVEARDGGSCVVRLVNSGFGSGEEWDDQYDGMTEGWELFLANLRLHLTHFPGRTASASLPMTMWEGPRDAVWARLLDELQLPADAAVGDRVAVSGDAPPLAGTVAAVFPTTLLLVVDEPTPGTAFLTVEGRDGPGPVSVSIWSYLYDDAGAGAVARDESAWNTWLNERGVPMG